ncbi:Cof-type HAD-IIB family hydrolase [Mycoplasmopsis primatum]|uniref:Cof-type HAD-IIB family hydrolase n=1 Tax=Mycoplasmopsis primatum TaxID=55604 RepID=UPI00049575BB|nr:HAD family hydrolase [Mycoplasmopsis primatum]
MKQRPDIIFIDLDGTTLDTRKNSKRTVSDKNLEYIKKARELGIRVVVSTGRKVPEENNEIFNSLNSMNDFIAWNGSVVKQNSKIIFEKWFDDHNVSKMIQYADKNNIVTIVNSNRNKIFSNNWFIKFLFKLGKANVQKYTKFNYNEKVYKLIFWCLSKKKLLNIYNHLIKEFNLEFEIALTGKNNNIIEITPKGCTKGLAQQLYAHNLGIDKTNCIHIGDTLNDASTVGIMGKVVAMKNASEEFKKVADIISPFSYKTAGLGKTLAWLLDIK